MKCRKCEGRAAVEVRRHNLALCGPHYLEWFEAQVDRTIRRYRMFSHGDRVLVAVSGGKDSLALWEVLHRLGYNATGLHIHLGIGGYSQLSYEKTRHYAAERGLPLITVNLAEEYGLGVPQLARALHRVACSGCGLSKRYIMNRVAVERGFTVVATGHNMDDEAATLLGNLLHWQTGALARQSPVLESTHPRLARRVKPLFLMAEKDTASYALLRGIDYVAEECPHALGAVSLVYKDALNTVEAHSPGTKHQFLAGFLERMHPLLQRGAEASLGECAVCGYPTTTEVCAFCRTWERARQRAGVATPRVLAEAPAPEGGS